MIIKNIFKLTHCNSFVHYFSELAHKWSCTICEAVNIRGSGLVRGYYCKDHYLLCEPCMKRLRKSSDSIAKNQCPYPCKSYVTNELSHAKYPSRLVRYIEKKERDDRLEKRELE